MPVGLSASVGGSAGHLRRAISLRHPGTLCRQHSVTRLGLTEGLPRNASTAWWYLRKQGGVFVDIPAGNMENFVL